MNSKEQINIGLLSIGKSNFPESMAPKAMTMEFRYNELQ